MRAAVHLMMNMLLMVCIHYDDVVIELYIEYTNCVRTIVERKNVKFVNKQTVTNYNLQIVIMQP